MSRILAALLLVISFEASACAADTSAEEALRSEMNEWATYALELEDELVRLNWDVCTALWDWAHSLDPSWEDESAAHIVESFEDSFEYWREGYGRLSSGQHEGQKFYDGFCYWSG